MEVIDKNQTLEPPEGYVPQEVVAEGAYLRLKYIKLEWTKSHLITHMIVLFLNDQGREVLRTYNKIVRLNDPIEPFLEESPTMIELVIEGIQYLWRKIRCRKN